MQPAYTRAPPVYPAKHFQYDLPPVDSGFLPPSSVASTIADARALVSRADSGLPIRRPPPSLQNPTRPETPAVHRRSSAFARASPSHSAARNSLSFTLLSPITTPLASRPASVDRWSRATSSSSASRGWVERQEGDEGDELTGYSEWEEMRPKTAAAAELLTCREEEAVEPPAERCVVEERKEQLDESSEDNGKDAQHEKPSPAEDSQLSRQFASVAESEATASVTSASAQQRAESAERAVEWHKPVLQYAETDSKAAPAAVDERNKQREQEEKEQSSSGLSLEHAPAMTAVVSRPAPAAPSLRQLSESLVSLVYLACKLHDEPASLSDPQLDHLYSLASSCLAHLTAPSSFAQLAAAFLPLRPATAHHHALHCPLLVSLLTALFGLSRQADNDSLLCPLLPLLLLPPDVLPSKQTLMCLFSLLVNASCSEEGARAVAGSDWLVWLLQRVDDELAASTRDDGQVDAQLDERRVLVCVEVTAIMRNIACAPHAHRLFIEPLPPSVVLKPASALTSTLSPRSPPTALDRLCQLLLRFPAHSSLALNVLRILSKLSLHSDCRTVLDRQVECIEALVCMLQSFHGKLALCVRVCFTLGNLTMTNADNRFVIADAIIATTHTASTDGLSVLLSLLTRTHQRNNKLLALLASASSSPAAATAASSSSKHRLMLRENVDLLVKLIRLTANLAIHHDVGRRLVGDGRTALLVDVLREANARSEEAQSAGGASLVDSEKAEELTLNAISCMTNLSYYLATQHGDTASAATTGDPPPLFLFHPLSSVLPLLTPHLLSPNRDTLTSLLRLLANLTRQHATRQLLYAAAVDEAVLLLLSHGDAEVVEVCAGVVLNCSVDERWADERLANEPSNLLTLVDAADGDEDEEDEAEQAEEREEAEAPLGGLEAATDRAQSAAEEDGRKWRLRGLVGKVLCNMRRRQQRLELDEEVVERIESTVNEWVMELNDRAEERGDENRLDVVDARAHAQAAAVDEAELLSVLDAVLLSCSRLE